MLDLHAYILKHANNSDVILTKSVRVPGSSKHIVAPTSTDDERAPRPYASYEVDDCTNQTGGNSVV